MNKSQDVIGVSISTQYQWFSAIKNKNAFLAKERYAGDFALNHMTIRAHFQAPIGKNRGQVSLLIEGLSNYILHTKSGLTLGVVNGILLEHRCAYSLTYCPC